MYWMQYFWGKNSSTWKIDLHSNTEDSYKHAVIPRHILAKSTQTLEVKNDQMTMDWRQKWT